MYWRDVHPSGSIVCNAHYFLDEFATGRIHHTASYSPTTRDILAAKRLRSAAMIDPVTITVPYPSPYADTIRFDVTTGRAANSVSAMWQIVSLADYDHELPLAGYRLTEAFSAWSQLIRSVEVGDSTAKAHAHSHSPDVEYSLVFTKLDLFREKLRRSKNSSIQSCFPNYKPPLIAGSDSDSGGDEKHRSELMIEDAVSWIVAQFVHEFDKIRTPRRQLTAVAINTLDAASVKALAEWTRDTVVYRDLTRPGSGAAAKTAAKPLQPPKSPIFRHFG